MYIIDRTVQQFVRKRVRCMQLKYSEHVLFCAHSNLNFNWLHFHFYLVLITNCVTSQPSLASIATQLTHEFSNVTLFTGCIT
jgi:hypothetical protein